MGHHTFVAQVCAGLAGTGVSQPFGEGHDVWKVGGKIFAIVSGAGGGVSVKTDHVDTARLLIEQGRAARAPYLHASWAQVSVATVGEDEVCDRIAASYALIRANLPRKVQAGLG